LGWRGEGSKWGGEWDGGLSFCGSGGQPTVGSGFFNVRFWPTGLKLREVGGGGEGGGHRALSARPRSRLGDEVEGCGGGGFVLFYLYGRRGIGGK